MKKFSKVASLILAAALIVSCFAGCGKDTSNKTYIIGGTGPLTGDFMSYGVSVKNGASLAVKEINENGGLNGVKFSLEMLDDKGAPAEASTAYDQLFDKGMQISIGSVTSGACQAFAAKAADDGLFFITPAASTATIIENRETAFRVCFGDPDQGILSARELAGKYENIGVIYNSSDPYSTGVFDAFKAEMKTLNASFKDQSFDDENDKDFSAQIEALKDCDVIFLPIYYDVAGLIAKTCVSKGCDADLFGCDGLDGVADQIDDTVTNNISYITPFDVNSTNATTAKFVAAYKAEYGESPDQFAADGYDAVYAIYEAMKAAGVNDVNISYDELAKKVVEAITADGFVLKGATGDMTWDASGACTKAPQIVKLGK